MNNEEYARSPADITRHDAPWRFITRNMLYSSDSPESNKSIYRYFLQEENEIQSIENTRKLCKVLKCNKERIVNLKKGEKRKLFLNKKEYIVWRERIINNILDK